MKREQGQKGRLRLIIRDTVNCLLLGTILWVDQGLGSRVTAQPLTRTQPIASGTYWVSGMGETALILTVEGNQYYYADETGRTDWQPISRLKPIKAGILFGEGRYWCLSTLPGERGTCSPNGWIPSLPNPSTIKSCGRALVTSQVKLLEAGNLVSLQANLMNVGDRYPDNPTPRPQGYELLMIGRGGYRVLASNQLMASVSNNILAHCPTISLVSFLAYPEGVGTFGLVNGKVQEFGCYEAYDLGQSPHPKPPWGYESCL